MLNTWTHECVIAKMPAAFDIKMFALMREYISTYFYTIMVKWRLILTWYYIDGDNFRLHIFLRQEKTD